MENELVVVKNGEPRASSWILKDGFGFENDHRYVVRMIKKYQDEIKQFGVIATERQQPTDVKGGRPIEAFLLNRNQTMFLGTLFRNTSEVVKFKVILIQQFDRLEKELTERAIDTKSAEWIEHRKLGKIQRKEEVYIIEKFIEYARKQGSKNAHHYYCNLTKMENQALFFIMEKFPNLREVMDMSQLIAISAADQIVVKALRDGMALELPYKKIYQRAKEGVLLFASVIGKSPLPKQITFEDGKTQIEFL